MSWWNNIVADWVCPLCQSKQGGGVHIRYGAQSLDLAVGENIKWGQATDDDLAERLPNDTGSLVGWSTCSNAACDGRRIIPFRIEIVNNEIKSILQEETRGSWGADSFNERLSHLRIFTSFHRAVRNQDKATIKMLLVMAGLTEAEAEGWILGDFEACYWQNVLPEKLQEHGLKAPFEEAIRRQDPGRVVTLLCQMGMTEECAKHHAPTYVHNYFWNYGNVPPNIE